MRWITTQKNGASALGLQRVLGLRQYQTAWTWLHKLRSAMVRRGRDLLGGGVEVDESYLGGVEEGVRGRKTETKALIKELIFLDRNSRVRRNSRKLFNKIYVS